MQDAPLARLWYYARPYRLRITTAALWSFLNKATDIAPPFLIGMAVDVVVRQEDSFLASLGIEDPRAQLVVLAAITFVVWALESIFEYLQGVAWRNLAQTVRTTCGSTRTHTCRDSRSGSSRIDAPVTSWRCSTTM